MMLAAMMFLIGALIQGFAHEQMVFVVARIMGGMAVGAASVLSPAYISEVAPATIRGRMTTIQQIMIITGLTAAFVVNYCAGARAATRPICSGGYEAWRWMYWMQVIPAAIFLIALLFIPESPRYLVSRDAMTSQVVLTRLFGAGVVRRQDRGYQAASARIRDRASAMYWLGNPFVRLFGRDCCLRSSSSWSASTSSSTTAPPCGSRPALPKTALQINIVSGVVSIAICSVTAAMSTAIGRKPLLLVGSAGMAATLFAMAYASPTARSMRPLQLPGSDGLIALGRGQPLRHLLQRQLGSRDVGDAGRDVPQPDPR